MKTEEEIQAKLDDLTKTLKELPPDAEHFKRSWEAQQYILDWILEKRG